MAGNYILTLFYYRRNYLITAVLTEVHHCNTTTVFIIMRTRLINVLNIWFDNFQKFLSFLILEKGKCCCPENI